MNLKCIDGPKKGTLINDSRAKGKTVIIPQLPSEEINRVRAAGQSKIAGYEYTRRTNGWTYVGPAIYEIPNPLPRKGITDGDERLPTQSDENRDVPERREERDISGTGTSGGSGGGSEQGEEGTEGSRGRIDTTGDGSDSGRTGGHAVVPGDAGGGSGVHLESDSNTQPDQARRPEATGNAEGGRGQALKYTGPSGVVEAIQYRDSPDNSRAVLDFIGPQPECKICGGRGEYEGSHGPVGCQPCNSRLIIIRSQQPELHADWGQWILKYEDGKFDVLDDGNFRSNFTEVTETTNGDHE